MAIHFFKILAVFLAVNSAVLMAEPPPPSAPSASALSCKKLIVRERLRQTKRQNFILRYADKIYSDEIQNQTWIDQAFEDTQTHFDKTKDQILQSFQSEEPLYVVMEHSKIKQFNDKFNDKDFVTALINFHKEIFYRNIVTYLPDITHKIYFDFKSVKIRIDGAYSSKTIDQIRRVFEMTHREFFTSPLISQILRSEDLSTDWYSLGMGHTVDQASLAARFARSQPNGIQSYWDKEFQTEIEEQRRMIKELHQSLVSNSDATGLFEPGSEPYQLQSLVFAHFRKAKDPHQFLSALQREFPNENLDLELVQLLSSYIKAVDSFSPSLLIAKREVLSIHQAPFGALSIDFIGLGADNLKVTADAVLRSENLIEAIHFARNEERKLTTGSFLRKKALVEETVKLYFNDNVSIRFSGDDGIIIPGSEVTLRDQLALLRRLSSLLPDPFFRLVYLSPKAAQSEHSSQLITHAESMEKALRPILQEELGSLVARNIHIQIFNPDIEEDRSVYLILSLNVILSKEQKQIIRSAFFKAVKKVETALKESGENLYYNPVDIFATSITPPKDPLDSK